MILFLEKQNNIQNKNYRSFQYKHYANYCGKQNNNIIPGEEITQYTL